MNKKGAGSVVSTLILFITILILTASLVVYLNEYTSNTQDSMKVESERISNKLKTSLEIIYIDYNTSNNNLSIYVKNTGKTKLITKYINLYIDGKFLSNFSFYYPDNLSKKMDLLEPLDTVLIKKDITLQSGTHSILLVTEYGNKVEDFFNV